MSVAVFRQPSFTIASKRSLPSLSVITASDEELQRVTVYCTISARPSIVMERCPLPGTDTTIRAREYSTCTLPIANSNAEAPNGAMLTVLKPRRMPKRTSRMSIAISEGYSKYANVRFCCCCPSHPKRSCIHGASSPRSISPLSLSRVAFTAAIDEGPPRRTLARASKRAMRAIAHQESPTLPEVVSCSPYQTSDTNCGPPPDAALHRPASTRERMRCERFVSGTPCATAIKLAS
mmetsp:Transcript_46611/g.122394  ORF Transcript_46611/g.122394 Transcript_46611/m.122394 type:complete len:235 (+) Transcript_46611:74-778(+)